MLVVHGYTSSHHAAGRNAKGKQGRGVTEGAPGWFDALIGPGKAVDTNVAGFRAGLAATRKALRAPAERAQIR